MPKNKKTIEEIKKEMVIAVDQYNKVQEKIEELQTVSDFLRLKISSYEKDITKLESDEKNKIIETKAVN